MPEILTHAEREGEGGREAEREPTTAITLVSNIDHI